VKSHPTHSSTAAHYIFVHRGWGTEGVLIGITSLPSCPTGMIAVRLNEVRPDGASARVTFGLLNLAHRGGDSAHPVPMQPGRVEVVTLRLNDAAYTFGVGCRLRLAISTRCNLYSPTCRLGGRANRLTSHHTHTQHSSKYQSRRYTRLHCRALLLWRVATGPWRGRRTPQIWSPFRFTPRGPRSLCPCAQQRNRTQTNRYAMRLDASI
jgi:hypothetical protein